MSVSGKTVARLGNYSTPAQQRVERKPAQLIRYQGPRAHIRFHDGTAYAMPSEPLLKIGLPEGAVFFIITTWSGRTPVESRVELPADARPALGRVASTPKVMVREGRRMITRPR